MAGNTMLVRILPFMAAGMFALCVITWLLDMDPMVSIAIGLVALADLGLWGFLTLRGRSTIDGPSE